MRIQILYFAVLRERLKREQEAIELPADATVGDALEALAGRHPTIAALLPRVQTAVNRAFASASLVLQDSDELALIPPVAGGAPERRVAILATALSLTDVVNAVAGPERGGIVTFTGAVRRQGQRADVVRLEYEAYVPMAIEVLTAIADEIELESPGVRVAIHHRIGTLVVGEAAVVIAASAPHRAEAFAACRVGIERLKQRAPIWKKEIGESGAVWVGTGP